MKTYKHMKWVYTEHLKADVEDTSAKDQFNYLRGLTLGLKTGKAISEETYKKLKKWIKYVCTYMVNESVWLRKPKPVRKFKSSNDFVIFVGELR